jgi:hypothetical protein
MKFSNKIMSELREIGSVTLFFFIGFLFITTIFKLLLEDYQIKFYALSKALLGALIIGKVVIISNKWSGLHMFKKHPGYINILYKTLVYIIGVFTVLAIERIIDSYKEMGTISLAVKNALETRTVHHVLAITLLITFFFLIYNSMEQIISRTGKQKLLSIFLDKE